MTLQHESTLPLPEGMQPGLVRALQLVLRELDQVVIPDLQSERARSAAGMLGQILRDLIIRETSLPELLEEWTVKQEALLQEAGIELKPAKSTPFDYHHRITTAVAAAAAARMSAGKLDEWSRRAVQAEHAHITAKMQAVREMPYLQNSPERAAQLDVTPERMTAYLFSKLQHQGSLIVSKVQKLLGGFSKETFIIDVEIDGKPMPVVMRRNIALSSVAGSVMDEMPLLQALYAQGMKVPEPLVIEPDRSIFGEAFAIIRKAKGDTAFSNIQGLVMDSGQQKAARALAGFLGRLHNLDASQLSLPISFFNPDLSMADCVLRQIEFYEKFWFSRSSQPSPIMSAAFAWLRANLPASSGRPRIIHGDAGLHNMMIDCGEISVMLDWELAHMGDPVEDLAYCRTWIDQALPWDEFLAIYYRHGGLEYRPEYERFYRVLANLRVVVFAAQSSYGSHWSDHPELTLMFASTHYHTVFADMVAKQLAGE